MAFCRGAAAGLIFAVMALAPPAHAVGGEDVAASASTLDVTYTIYAGGITLGELSVGVRMEGDAYKAISTLRTSGVVDALWRAKIEASSSGTVENGRVKPSLYYASSQHDDVNQQVTVTYPANGAPTYRAEPAYRDPKRIAMPDAQKINTLDPVSAMVSLTTMLAGGGDGAKPCAIALPVYDARRRYDVALSFERNTKVNMDNGLYSGAVDVCRLAYKPIAGPPQRVVRDGKLPPVRVWMAETKDAADPSRLYRIPLRIWAESDFGIAAAVLTSVKIDGTKLSKLN
jgi:hypothetical protein